MDLTFLTQNYQALGLTSAGTVALFFLFKDVYEKIKKNNDALEQYKKDQEKICKAHKDDGHENFKRLEEKIDKVVDNVNLGFNTLNGRIETLTGHVIDFFKQAGGKNV